VEQLASVFGGALEATGLVASGAVVGGVWHPEGQSGGAAKLERALEARRGGEEGGEFKAIRRGWCLGEETFRKELLAQMSERLGPEHYGA